MFLFYFNMSYCFVMWWRVGSFECVLWCGWKTWSSSVLVPKAVIWSLQADESADEIKRKKFSFFSLSQDMMIDVVVEQVWTKWCQLGLLKQFSDNFEEVMKKNAFVENGFWMTLKNIYHNTSVNGWLLRLPLYCVGLSLQHLYGSLPVCTLNLPKVKKNNCFCKVCNWQD